MAHRSDIADISKRLRAYLEWQAAPLSGSRPASPEQRAELAERTRSRELARANATREQLRQDVSPTSAPASPAEPTPDVAAAPAPALWKEFGSRPRPTYAGPTAFDQSSTPEERLRQIRTELGDCRRCELCQGRNNIVFGGGSPSARLMFIGEAPGHWEDQRGEPFVGKAGELLDRMIAAMTFARTDVYITNVIKCRPPQNRDPTPEEVGACRPFVEDQIRAIEPEVIVALGRFAANMLTQNTASLSRIRGRWHEHAGVAVMPTYHPAYLLRNPADKRYAWDDLQKVMARLGVSRAK